MELKNPMPVVTDMDQTVAFYKRILGLQLVTDFGANKVLTGGLALQTLETYKEFIGTSDISFGGNNFEIYFEEDDFDKFAENLQKYHVQYVHPVKEHSWGQRVVRFYDPDRYIIEVGENMILETERLYLREMNQFDFESLCKILQDEDTMYAYEGAFSDDEVQEWLDRQIDRYQKWQFGLWAVILKETDEMIGQCGLTMQPWKDEEVLEIGYLFERLYWHKGYATEAAKACKKYAFEVLKAKEVCSIIRDTNIASQNVAIRNGMTMAETWIKHYRGVDMLHYRYVVQR